MSVIQQTRRYMHRNIGARISALLALPLFWLVVIYIGSLAALFITSIWKIDTFTSKVVREFTLQNFIDVFSDRAYFNVTIRTLFVALCVTLICAIIAIPMAFFMARIAKPKSRPVLIALRTRCPGHPAIAAGCQASGRVDRTDQEPTRW